MSQNADVFVCCEKEITYKNTGKKVTLPGWDGSVINSSEAATALAKGFLADKPIEEIWAIAINSAGQVLGALKIAQGSINHTCLYPRNVFSFLFSINASSMIITHNHPGGFVEPSVEDVTATSDLAFLARKLSCQLLDHIIISGDDAFSFIGNGLSHVFKSGGSGNK